MDYRGRPLGRSARAFWPLAWLACASGTSGDDVGIGGDDAGATVEEAGELGPDGASSASDAPTGQPQPSLDSGGDNSTAADDAGGGLENDASVEAAPSETPDALPCACTSPAVCVAGKCIAALRVFVSSATYDGALGGHAGADATCQSLATAAALGGTWMAWISDATSSPAERFTPSSAGYVLLDGTLVAASWAALTSSGPAHAIDLTETSASLAAADANDSKTWTATLVGAGLGTASCSNFGSNAATETGEVGHCTGTGTVNWTSAYMTEECNVQNHIYCFEQ